MNYLQLAIAKNYTIYGPYGKIATSVDFETAHKLVTEQVDDHNEMVNTISDMTLIDMSPIEIILNASRKGAIKVGPMNVVACASFRRHPLPKTKEN